MEELIPDSVIKIDTRWGMLQYAGKHFESAEYQNSDRTKFRYTITFLEDNDPQFGKGFLVKFTRYDKKGVKIDKTYSSGSVRKSNTEK